LVVEDTPETGDASFVWALVTAISGLSLVILPVIKKKLDE